MTSSGAADRDFIAYWAAGQQLAHHANPYDSTEVLRIEHAAGYIGDRRPNTGLVDCRRANFTVYSASLRSKHFLSSVVVCSRKARKSICQEALPGSFGSSAP